MTIASGTGAKTQKAPPLCVLLIEDNSADARFIRELIRPHASRFELVHKSRLRDGMDFLKERERPVDVILLDLSLPESQGLDTFMCVRAEALESPVIVLTGLDDERIATRAVQEGAQDYLLKDQVDGGLLFRSILYAIERKRAETALREKTRLLETFFKHTITPLAFLDTDFKLIQANEAYAKACGRDTRELAGQDHFALCRSDATGTVFERVVATKEPYQAMAWPFAFSDHSQEEISYWDWTLVPNLGSCGEVEFLVLSMNDVTARKQVEESLRRSHEELEKAVREKTQDLIQANQSLMAEMAESRRAKEELHESQLFMKRLNEMIPDVIYLYDLAEHRNIYINKKGFLGYTSEEIAEMGNSFLKRIMHPDDFSRTREHLERCLELDDSRVLEHEFRMKHARTGKYRWFRSWDVVFSRDSDGVPRVILGSARDITQSKELQDRLLKIEQLFSQFAENVDSVIWIASVDGNQIIYINQAYEKVWGRSRESLMEKPFSWYDAVYVEDREEVSEILAGHIREEHHRREYRILRPDGTTRWIRDRGFPIRNSDGEILYLAGIAEDITREMRLRQEAEYRFQQILQADKLASLGEVVAGVAHEINNPNSFISYNIPLLEQTWKLIRPIVAEYALSHPKWESSDLSIDELCKDMGEIIEDIKTGSDRINKVVRNLKDFARMDETGQPVPVRINEVVEKAMTFVGAQLRKKVARIEVDLSDGLPEIEGHFSRLEQVVSNLLVNAAHAIDDRERGRISITTRLVERLGSILIEIEDNGLGMTREVMDHIFDPFFTTRRASGGTGLGLSVSHGLVHDHKGIMGILSRPNLGSRFTVYLPIDSSVQLDLHPTILCVDDDTVFLNMLQTHFIRVKEYFKGVHDPESVLAFLNEHPEVDVVMSDLMMPNMNGWELLARVKERFPLVTFVLYSGDPTALQSRPKHVPKPDHTLEKPFEMRRLIDIIASTGRQKL